MALDAKGNELEFTANIGFWNTGNTLNVNPNNDTGIQAVLNKYGISAEQTFESLSDIDFSVIDEADLRITFKDNAFKNWALQP